MMTTVRSLSASAAAASADDALDIGKLIEVEALLGEASSARLLDRLRLDIAERLGDDLAARADRLEIASAAHAMVSSAGFLGFSALSGVCAALERACRQDLPLDGPMARMAFERDRALFLLSPKTAAAA